MVYSASSDGALSFRALLFARLPIFGALLTFSDNSCDPARTSIFVRFSGEKWSFQIGIVYNIKK
jgi:hypothetical protein